jgi:hypothetical protein
MNLISDSKHAQIRNRLQDVIDTFFKTPVQYHLHSTEFADGTMQKVNKPYIEHNLHGFVEYPDTDGTEIDEGTEGAIERTEVKIMFGYDDLDKLGLISNLLPIFRPEEDEFIVAGKTYKVTFAAVDGALQPNNVLVIVHGRLRTKYR